MSEIVRSSCQLRWQPTNLGKRTIGGETQEPQTRGSCTVVVGEPLFVSFSLFRLRLTHTTKTTASKQNNPTSFWEYTNTPMITDFDQLKNCVTV